jgi:hypothetical protein
MRRRPRRERQRPRWLPRLRAGRSRRYAVLQRGLRGHSREQHQLRRVRQCVHGGHHLRRDRDRRLCMRLPGLPNRVRRGLRRHADRPEQLWRLRACLPELGVLSGWGVHPVPELDRLGLHLVSCGPRRRHHRSLLPPGDPPVLLHRPRRKLLRSERDLLRRLLLRRRDTLLSQQPPHLRVHPGRGAVSRVTCRATAASYRIRLLRVQRQPEVGEDTGDHCRVVDRRQQDHPPAAATRGCSVNLPGLSFLSAPGSWELRRNRYDSAFSTRSTIPGSARTFSKFRQYQSYASVVMRTFEYAGVHPSRCRASLTSSTKFASASR